MYQPLKQCPFCNGFVTENEIQFGEWSNMWSISCNDCHASTGNHFKKEDAIKAWNQRPYDYDMPAIVKKVQQLQLENDKTKATLKIYANRDEWSSEAKFEYETGNLLATGDYETDEGSVCLDGDLYWCGYGNDGYELAEKVLGELESCKQPE